MERLCRQVKTRQRPKIERAQSQVPEYNKRKRERILREVWIRAESPSGAKIKALWWKSKIKQPTQHILIQKWKCLLL